MYRQEFKANRKNEKRLYKRIRKKYKRWTYGNMGVLICIAVIAGLFIWVSKNGGVSFDALVVSIGISFVPFLLLCFMRAIAISGGREVLFNRISDQLVLKENDFSMEYIQKMIFLWNIFIKQEKLLNLAVLFIKWNIVR